LVVIGPPGLVRELERVVCEGAGLQAREGRGGGVHVVAVFLYVRVLVCSVDNLRYLARLAWVGECRAADTWGKVKKYWDIYMYVYIYMGIKGSGKLQFRVTARAQITNA